MKKIADILKISLEKVNNATDIKTLDSIRVTYVGKKGEFTNSLKKLGTLSPEERPAAGESINKAKSSFMRAVSLRKKELEDIELDESLRKNAIDVSLEGYKSSKGGRHPISIVRNHIERIFGDAGFDIKSGPEIEDDFHNFTALNIPKNHPARAMHDTFYLENGNLLRTHTSPVQIRSLLEQGAPIRIIAPGRVYRCDSDQTHTPMFHQVEGLVIDEAVSFSNLKAILHQFVGSFFEREVELRFRPSYFPFTEPSAEVDILWGKDKWLEILGCGMVHPEVLLNAGVDPKKYSGYAFGMGIERLAMLRYNVEDLRVFFDNDLSFLRQFN
ncbi:MAG: phenylalanine--tRNA ligase subunit alpha [Woeseiaceae bacterium]|jgi:phenylalanyl-tRNA synthetase alpha chain|nr:phenylalanine--tRNA ligase subunit alpha [Woeseiaceae bacterium]MDG1015385.1 phenylalanine--tRNA ligase subunit alpha [Woeseiaceae bacterium]